MKCERKNCEKGSIDMYTKKKELLKIDTMIYTWMHGCLMLIGKLNAKSE